MPLSSARVVLEFRNITGIASQTLTAGNTMYARAFVTPGAGAARLATGRSRPIPAAGGTFNLAPEAVPWRFDLDMDPGNNIGIRVEILIDHGDAAPTTPAVITGTINDPWTTASPTFGSGPACQVQVTTRLVNPTDAAFLARAVAASGVSGSLTVPQALAVQITRIDGLYKPVSPLPAPPNPGSTAIAGYTSKDNLGRIFTNRLTNGNWQTGAQFIDVYAQVSAIGAIAIPGPAKIRWTILDADDPTNDESNFHRQGGAYVDANDYAAGVSTGAHGNDNAAAHHAGNVDEDILLQTGHRGNSRWDTAPGGPAPAPTSRTVAESPLSRVNPHTSVTSVRIHCPNVLGTSFQVKAELIHVPGATPVHNTATGVMTMWSRIRVEVRRMAHAHSLAGALPLIPPFFLPLCVQLDFEAEQTVAGAQDLANIATPPVDESTGSSTWVDAVFSHGSPPGAGLPRPGGWFFLGSARLGSPAAGGASPPPFFTGTAYTLGTTGLQVWVEVLTPIGGGTPDFVEFNWTHALHGALTASFDVINTVPGNPGQTRIVLRGNDVTPNFLGHDADGSLVMSRRSRMLFWPRHQRALTAGALSPGGFSVPNAGPGGATIEVSQPGAVFTTGISPPRTHAGNDFFAGQTIIFTHTRSFSIPGPPITPKPDFNNRVLSTVVHEFLHAFGMPHKCGRFDWRTPRTQSCCMNYFNTWLFDGVNLLPGTTGREGNHMCARHLMEVRRVHFANNPALNW